MAAAAGELEGHAVVEEDAPVAPVPAICFTPPRRQLPPSGLLDDSPRWTIDRIAPGDGAHPEPDGAREDAVQRRLPFTDRYWSHSWTSVTDSESEDQFIAYHLLIEHNLIKFFKKDTGKKSNSQSKFAMHYEGATRLLPRPAAGWTETVARSLR